MYDIIFEKKALKFFKKLDKSFQNKIGKKIEQLNLNPKFGIPLVANLSGLYKLRIGKYRVIYKIIKNKLVILILDIGLRKNIYD